MLDYDRHKLAIDVISDLNENFMIFLNKKHVFLQLIYYKIKMV
jgi:hypothetical protein